MDRQRPRAPAGRLNSAGPLGRIAVLLAALAGVGIAAGFLTIAAGSKAREALPADAGQILEEAAAVDGLLALLVQRDGRRVLEGYFDDAREDDLLHLRSMTKSVTSLLLGIAIDRGHLTSVDQTLGEILGDRAERFGPRKAALTLEHLLTMSAGLEWNEDDVDEFNRLVTARDPVAHYLERPFVAEPGERWTYSSGASHLLSAVLSEVTGMTAAEFARRHLFEALEIRRFRWRELADGNTNGAAGLELRPRDAIKLGELLLNGGSWSGRRVVSREWIEASLHPHLRIRGTTHYGYQWWLELSETVRMWMALGYAGQTLSVLPEEKLVILTSCRWRSLSRSPEAQSEDVHRFLSDRVGPFLIPRLAAAR